MSGAGFTIASSLDLSLIFLTGIGIFYGVQKFFEKVDEKLAPEARLKIALWLLDAKTAPAFEPWPNTFARVFDRVFGRRHLTWHCFDRSCVASFFAVAGIGIYLTATVLVGLHQKSQLKWPTFSSSLVYLTAFLLPPIGLGFIFGNAIPDYVSLLKTRWLLSKMQQTNRRSPNSCS